MQDIRAHAEKDRSGLSLRAKYIAFACLITVVASLLLGGLNFYWVNRLSKEQAIARLNDSARAIATEVEFRFNRLENDATSVSQMPPFQGIIRSIKNDGIDPLDGSTTELWIERLQTIFKATMRRRIEYVQMRYIEVFNRGQELVRVDNRDGHLVVVPEAELQQKMDRPYVAAGTLLSPAGVHFSQVEQNVENGTPDPDLYVLRVVTQVRDDRGGLFGLMVINTDYEAEIQSILKQAEGSFAIYVIDDSGKYIKKSTDGVVSRIVTPGSPGYELPPGYTKTAPPTEHYAEQDGLIFSRADVGFDYQNANRRISVYIAADKAKVLASAHRIQQFTLGVSFVLIGLAVAGAYYTASLVAEPMRKSILSIEAFSRGRAPLNLPTDRADEIGGMSRAFTKLVESLEKARSEERATLAQLQAIADNTVDALMTMDESGKILSLNKAAVVLFGYSHKEAIGKSVEMLLRADHADRHDESAEDSEHPSQVNVLGHALERKGVRKDGTEFPIELTISEVDVGGRRLFSAIARDISERQAFEERLIKSAEALRRSNDDLEEFAYIASHDLKEPLRAISNHAQFLGEDHGDDLGPDGLKRLDRIKALCADSERLISDLFQYSRIGRADEKRQTIDVTQTVNDIRESMADYLEERRAVVEIETEMPDVIGDPSRIKSVFQNLIVNGVKYNDREEKRIAVGYIHTVGKASGKFYVRDNGIGIPEEHQKRIFSIFKRLFNKSAYGEGSGVGLSFVRKIVEQHGGSIKVVSVLGEGSTFVFDLPEADAIQDNKFGMGPRSDGRRMEDRQIS